MMYGIINQPIRKKTTVLSFPFEERFLSFSGSRSRHTLEELGEGCERQRGGDDQVPLQPNPMLALMRVKKNLPWLENH